MWFIVAARKVRSGVHDR